MELTVQNLSVGGAPALAAASSGGDTVPASARYGGWVGMGIALLFTVGPTETTITVDGTSFGPYTKTEVVVPVPTGPKGSRKDITYSQVSGVKVAAITVVDPQAQESLGG